MTGRCCVGGTASRRLARRLSKAVASILPGAALLLLPKCPLCLAAWLTFATGIGFSAAAAAWMRGMLEVFWIAAMALAGVPIVRWIGLSRNSAQNAPVGTDFRTLVSARPHAGRFALKPSAD